MAIGKSKFFKTALPNFKIDLVMSPQTIIGQNILGVHINYHVYANGLHIATFLDEKSSLRFMSHCVKTNFSDFLESGQGKTILNVLFLLHEKEKITKVDTDGDGRVIHDIKRNPLLND